MLKTARVTTFAVSELLRENQQEGGRGNKITTLLTQIKVNNEDLV